MHQRLTVAVLGIGLMLAATGRVEASPITWQWAGQVNGYQCAFSTCLDPNLAAVVPLGTLVEVALTLDVDTPTHPNPSLPCLWGQASTSLQVLGRTYTSSGFVWVDAFGFGPGICVPDANNVEIVVPSWGLGGAALPDGWIPTSAVSGLSGLWWSGDLSGTQPGAIASQFPYFSIPNVASPERFTADLQVVPEPGSLLLLATGLAGVAMRRRARRRRATAPPAR